jgi:hypothetical protein
MDSESSCFKVFFSNIHMEELRKTMKNTVMLIIVECELALLPQMSLFFQLLVMIDEYGELAV